jgi:hypothetical protein
MNKRLICWNFNLKGLTARRLYKSFGVKALNRIGVDNSSRETCLIGFFSADVAAFIDFSRLTLSDYCLVQLRLGNFCLSCLT